jgi:hypothetical protein
VVGTGLAAAGTVTRYLRPLLRFARDEIRTQEALGRLPPGQVSPEEIVDAAFAEVLRQPDAGQPYPRLRTLVRHAVEREARQYRRERSLFEPVGRRKPDDYTASGTPRRLADILPDPTSHADGEAAANIARASPGVESVANDLALQTAEVSG